MSPAFCPLRQGREGRLVDEAQGFCFHHRVDDGYTYKHEDNHCDADSVATSEIGVGCVHGSNNLS